MARIHIATQLGLYHARVHGRGAYPALPVPPPWAGDILKIDSQYFGDLVYLVERRQNVIDEPIDPPPRGTAAGDEIDSGSPSSG